MDAVPFGRLVEYIAKQRHPAIFLQFYQFPEYIMLVYTRTVMGTAYIQEQSVKVTIAQGVVYEPERPVLKSRHCQLSA